MTPSVAELAFAWKREHPIMAFFICLAGMSLIVAIILLVGLCYSKIKNFFNKRSEKNKVKNDLKIKIIDIIIKYNKLDKAFEDTKTSELLRLTKLPGSDELISGKYREIKGYMDNISNLFAGNVNMDTDERYFDYMIYAMATLKCRYVISAFAYNQEDTEIKKTIREAADLAMELATLLSSSQLEIFNYKERKQLLVEAIKKAKAGQGLDVEKIEKVEKRKSVGINQ